jgi:hypothetical protein
MFLSSQNKMFLTSAGPCWSWRPLIFWDIRPCSPLIQPTFQRNTSPPSSGSNNKPVSPWFLLGLFSTLKMELKFPSETFVDFQRTARLYILEDRTLKILRSNIQTNEHSLFSPGYWTRPKCWYVPLDFSLLLQGLRGLMLYSPVVNICTTCVDI